MAILKDLIVHGSSRFLNKIYANELEAPLISADAGVFKKLTAKDLTAETATVIGLLDVQGQLHTNTWTNSNIATIDGCFYITPTLSSDTGSIVFSSTSAASLAGTYTAVTSLYVGDATSGSTVQWTAGSNVLLTGQVKINNEWIPLGTLLGTLSGNATTSAIGLSGLTDNRHNTSSIITDIRNIVGSTSVKYRNLKISLYQRKDGNDSKPLGIYMTAMGANGKTFIDIYGGVEATTTAGSSGGFADPNLRIGNLSGLGAVEGTTPQGWGIYTTNGYFKGVIVSSAGKIGGWSIGTSGIYNGITGVTTTGSTAGTFIGTGGISNYKDTSTYVNIQNGVITAKGVNLTGQITATSGTIAGWTIKQNYLITGDNSSPGANILMLNGSGTTGSYTIAGTASTGWMITAGTTFGINKNGGVYATSGKIGGFDIGTSSIKNTKTSYSETTYDGVWVGTDGIGLGKGLFYVTNAGALTAKSGSIAGWSFNASSLYKTNATPGYSAATMVLSTGTASTQDIGGGGTTSKTWMISAGTGFGVTTAGALYCNDAHVSGEITATSGTIGGASITGGTLIVGNANINDINASKINAGDIAAARIQTNLISAIDAKVSDLSALTATIGGFQIDSSSVHTKSVAITSNADNSIALSSADFTRTINSTSRTGLRFAIGDKFGVTGDGTIYASNVDLTGKITATSGTIGGIQLDSNGKIWITDANISGTISANHIDASSLSIGISQVTDLQTTLNGKQASGDYATNTALSDVSTVANTALGQSIWYAECQTAAATAVKVATISPATTSFPNPLVNGTTVNVKFTNTNSATNTSLKLNVNNTGEKSIKYIYNGAITDIVKDYLKANQMYQFRYDGTYWIVQMMRNTNDNNVDRSLYAVALAASAAISAGRIAVLGTDNKLHTLDSTAFDISCPPLYVATAYTAANATSATTRTTNYSYWGTAFNLTNTHSIANAVANSNVYIVGTLSGDIFTPTTTVLTCSEPTTEDGLYYMLLGRMSTIANAVLQAEHPIYVFKNGAFQKLESTTATSYITYIDANDGIKVHNADDKTDYIQINSTAVSMYRNNKKMLSLGDSSLQFYKNDDATNSIAEFGATVRIGKSNAANFTIESTKMSGLGSAGRTYFETGDASQTSTQAFEGDGETTNFNLQKTNSIQQVTIDGSVLASSNYSLVTTDGINQIHFNTAPAEDAVIVVTYQATQQNPYFIFGTRKTSTTLGLGSVSLGRDLEASAPYSYAEGYANLATGLSSHAEGYNCGAIASYAHAGGFNSYATRDSAFAHGYYVISRGKGGLACGQYNVPDGRYMLCVGVGDSESTRANAFMVTKLGNTIMSGRFFSGTSANTGTYRAMFTTDDFYSDNISISATNVSGEKTLSVAKTGYTPIGIGGYEIGNASSSGTNAAPCFPYEMKIDGNNIKFNIRNTSGSASKIKITFYVYYIATAAL